MRQSETLHDDFIIFLSGDSKMPHTLQVSLQGFGNNLNLAIN